MRLLNKFAVAAAAVAALALMPARAEALTFQLNCIFGGGTTCSDIASLGTVTLTQDGANTVDGVVDLGETIDTTIKVFELVLNFDPALTDSGWNVAGTNVTGFTADENSIKPDGWGGFFDLVINFDSSTFEPQSFTITRAGLLEGNFNFLDTEGILNAAVHIGSFNDGLTECSLWVGSNPTFGTTGVPASCNGGGGGEDGVTIPEPASLLLFGLGAVGLAHRTRKRLVR